MKYNYVAGVVTQEGPSGAEGAAVSAFSSPRMHPARLSCTATFCNSAFGSACSRAHLSSAEPTLPRNGICFP